MAASYPNSAKTFSTKSDGVDLVQASHINDIQAEIKAIEDQLIAAKLSILSGAPTNGQVLTAVGTTPTWAAKAPDADKLDGIDSTGFLLVGGKAADADKLDGIDSTGFATAAHNHSGVYPQADGWTPASGTWSYASATTITVPSGAASLYAVGDKIKLTQTTVKYFYIVSVADTLLTITGGSSYTLANATISSAYYSHETSPLGFPQWFDYTPTPTGWSSTTQILGRFSIVGKTVTVSGLMKGTSNATGASVTLPATSANISGMFWGGATNAAKDNSVSLTNPSRWNISPNASDIVFYKDFAGAAWTASGTKEVYFTAFYELA